MNEEITTVSIGELIHSMAMAVADAQAALDRSSFRMAELMSGRYPLRDGATGKLVDAQGNPATEPVMVDSRVQFGHTVDAEGTRTPALLSMMELGFTPNFYQFVDTLIEVRLALRIEKTSARVDPLTGKSEGGALRIASRPLDAGYTSSYSYSLEFASVFKTKIVCVPPPATLEERLRALVSAEPSTGPEAGENA